MGNGKVCPKAARGNEAGGLVVIIGFENLRSGGRRSGRTFQGSRLPVVSVEHIYTTAKHVEGGRRRRCLDAPTARAASSLVG